jgi:hypothetical protein
VDVPGMVIERRPPAVTLPAGEFGVIVKFGRSTAIAFDGAGLLGEGRFTGDEPIVVVPVTASAVETVGCRIGLALPVVVDVGAMFAPMARTDARFTRSVIRSPRSTSAPEVQSVAHLNQRTIESIDRLGGPVPGHVRSVEGRPDR